MALEYGMCVIIPDQTLPLQAARINTGPFVKVSGLKLPIHRSEILFNAKSSRILSLVQTNAVGNNGGIFGSDNGHLSLHENANEDGIFASDNGHLWLPETATGVRPAEENTTQKKERKKIELSSVVNTLMGIPGGGSRAGLFRTPISGGVQSATSAHDLPRPALAVRNLMEQARFAHLCTVMSRMHQRRKGYPFGSLVDFAPDSMGDPLFSLSPLAIHTRNLLADPRCSLVVQIPGWSGLSNARVTIFGDIYSLPDDK
eukprot:TRINITY_DN8572_c0_g2_i4.p1 TRINITY_DN8572_c0_g2~~TRINITY_DN8572_c0_g2_i4.p1  ORF type:complete len:266 (-),score=37.08 TRINITY_DN8572_c0_g2_i4:782-1555(-)